jgi:hypothetical protein
MGQNEYIYGRLYDLTDKRAMSWLQKYAIWHDVWLILEDDKFQQFGKVWQDHVRRFAGTRLQLLTDKSMQVNYTHAKTFVW